MRTAYQIDDVILLLTGHAHAQAQGQGSGCGQLPLAELMSSWPSLTVEETS
jgi:hypothetical protein